MLGKEANAGNAAYTVFDQVVPLPDFNNAASVLPVVATNMLSVAE